MKLLIALIWAGGAYASLTINSSSIDATGQNVSVTMNGGALTGSTASCFSLSGGNGNSDTILTATASGSTVTLATAAPLYGEQTVTVTLSPAPGCTLSGSSGSAASSSATAVNSSEWHSAGGTPVSAYAQYDGSPAFGIQFGLDYPNMVTWNSTLGSISVNVAGATAVQIWAWHGSNAWCLEQDGSDSGSRQKLDGTSTFSDVTLATGLSGTHLYRVFGCAGQSAYQNSLLAAIRFVGGTLTGTIPAAKAIISCYGDSICGSGSAPDDSRNIDSWLDSLNNGYTAQIYSSSGSLVSGASGLATTTAHSELFGGAPISVMVVEGGVNDQAASVATGPGSTFRTAYSTMLSGLAAVPNPPAHMVVRGILPNLDANSSNWPNYVADQAAAATAAGVCMYHTGSLASGAPDWIAPTTSTSGCNVYSGAPATDTVDHLHPCAASSFTQNGYGKIANREAPIFAGLIAGSSFNVSGGAGSSPAFTTSAPFTVTLAGASTFFVDPVTVTSSNSGDTICIVGGACGTGSATLPVSWGQHTFQYTVMPATTGARTIGYTGLADCWRSPGTTSLTATGNTANGFLIGALRHATHGQAEH